MKGLLFFAGTFLRQLVNKPQETGIVMLYYTLLLLVAFLVGFDNTGGLGLVFVILFIIPIARSIFHGLPIDCLDYKAAIERERDLNH